MYMETMVKEGKDSFAMELPISDPKVMVLGLGGGGNNSINRLHSIGVHGARTVAMNTDRATLERVYADQRVLIGSRKTKGQGAGGFPEIGEYCAEEAREELEDILRGMDIVFLTTGMGGGTGTGSAPVVAEIAKELGCFVISMVTVPFTAEGKDRMQKAFIGIEKLRANSHSTIVLANDKLLKIVPNMPVNKAFSVMDQMISEIIKEFTEAITQPSLVNLDFADLRTVVGTGGDSTILYGENSACDPHTVVAEALDNPLVDVNYEGATGALIHITSGPELSLRTITEVVNGFTEIMDENANVKYGARTDPKFSGQLKVMAIMNGVETNYGYIPRIEMESMALQNACIPIVR